MKVCMKRLAEEHLEMVMNWRMLPHVTKYLNTDPKLTIEGQRKWFNRVKEDDAQLIWVIYVDEVPAGVIQLMDIDRVNGKCSWGYYIAEVECRSLKLAMYLEWNLYDYVFDTVGLQKLCNETFVLNKEVIKLHTLCGSHEDAVLANEVCKNGQYFDVSVGSISADEWAEIKSKHKYDKYEFE